jgi:hypothetical protein
VSGRRCSGDMGGFLSFLRFFSWSDVCTGGCDFQTPRHHEPPGLRPGSQLAIWNTESGMSSIQPYCLLRQSPLELLRSLVLAFGLAHIAGLAQPSPVRVFWAIARLDVQKFISRNVDLAYVTSRTSIFRAKLRGRGTGSRVSFGV